MAESNVKIANRALQHVGEKQIASLTENSRQARAVNTCFHALRKRLLRRYPWSFAISRASVAASASQTDWGELYRYAKPNDFLCLIRNKEIDYIDSRHDWTIEGQYIVTADSSPLQFRYVADVTDPTLFDPIFDEALAVLVAYNIVEQLTQSNTKKEALANDMVEVVKEAQRVNAIEKGSQDSVEDDWITAITNGI